MFTLEDFEIYYGLDSVIACYKDMQTDVFYGYNIESTFIIKIVDININKPRAYLCTNYTGLANFCNKVKEYPIATVTDENLTSAIIKVLMLPKCDLTRYTLQILANRQLSCYPLTLLNIIDEINNDFNQEVYDFFRNEEWFLSHLFMKLYEGLRYLDLKVPECKQEYNKAIGEITKSLEVEGVEIEPSSKSKSLKFDYLFRVDSKFKTDLTKHMVLCPNEIVPIDFDAFLFEHIFRMKR